MAKATFVPFGPPLNTCISVLVTASLGVTPNGLVLYFFLQLVLRPCDSICYANVVPSDGIENVMRSPAAAKEWSTAELFPRVLVQRLNWPVVCK